MQKVSQILKNAIVLTMDEDFHIHEPGAVAIDGEQIVAVGPEEQILEAYTSSETLDCEGKVLMPGLIDGHIHIPMTLLRGLADDLRLDVWLMGYMMPVEREFVTPDFVRLGTKIGCAELIRSGVTTFNDMYYYSDDIAEATAEVGLRALVGQTVMKFPSPDASSYEDSLARCEALIHKWQGHPLIIPVIAPHAVYTCPPEVLEAAAEMALKYDAIVHFHVSETEDEVENLRKEEGLPVVPYIRRYNLLETKLIAAHCVFVDEGEMRSMQHAGVGISHNPSSNLKLASGFAPVARMRELGLNVAIGTDGPASNNDLDMFEEMRLASFIAKPVAGDPTVLPAQEVLAMATSIGAKAMHIDELTGSLVPGKRADIILVDLSGMHNQPRFRRDPAGVYAQLVYAGKATDVSDVMVNGRWLMRDRDLLTLDESALIAQANVVAGEIDRFLKGREESVHSKLVAIGGTAEQESFEVQAKVPVTDMDAIQAALRKPVIKILRTRHFHEYDTYFRFDDPGQGRLRYREDEFLDERGKVKNVRSRLTLIGDIAKEESTGESSAKISRSRYLAPATQSLRFYNEYFKPIDSVEIEKNRLRYLIQYEDTEFYVNLDTLLKPDMGKFAEIKSRTWSRQDADNKALLMENLAEYLGLDTSKIVTEDYIEMVEKNLA